MKKLDVTLLVLPALLSACATTKMMPTEIALKDSSHRHIDDVAGSSPQETATKCAYNMVNASPSQTGASDVQYRIIGVNNPLVVEVDALLIDVGERHHSIPATYRCEYSNGRMVLGKWVRGL